LTVKECSQAVCCHDTHARRAIDRNIAMPMFCVAKVTVNSSLNNNRQAVVQTVDYIQNIIFSDLAVLAWIRFTVVTP